METQERLYFDISNGISLTKNQKLEQFWKN